MALALASTTQPGAAGGNAGTGGEGGEQSAQHTTARSPLLVPFKCSFQCTYTSLSTFAVPELQPEWYVALFIGQSVAGSVCIVWVLASVGMVWSNHAWQSACVVISLPTSHRSTERGSSSKQLPRGGGNGGGKGGGCKGGVGREGGAEGGLW